MSEEWLNWKVAGAWILGETHRVGCACSYHKVMTRRFGIKLPECKARNSWRVLYWHWRGRMVDLRWTLPESAQYRKARTSAQQSVAVHE